MLKRILLAGACVMWLAPATPISAQENATIVLRSGARASGPLVDHDARGFTILENGKERSFPTMEVAVVEFSGAPALSNDLVAKLNEGQHVLRLRNGQAVVGTLVDIVQKGRFMSYMTESGKRSYATSDIAALYVSSPNGSSGTSGGTGASPSDAGAIRLPANQQWVPTGLIVRAGETLTFKTTGELQLSNDVQDRAGAAGAYGQRRPGRSAPLPTAFAGALIGRINNGPAFAIGNLSSVEMPESGQLFLGINDDTLNDNAGDFYVSISRTGSGNRRRR
ncbi:MAG TPA: hypothetical protein VHJ77_19990 [Vicinamibacterales bacterium]|jgi:hypothetical protein|nr:hypothetical protein [Vicinamibacterales bacterium]